MAMQHRTTDLLSRPSSAQLNQSVRFGLQLGRLAIRANTDNNYEGQFRTFAAYCSNVHLPPTHPMLLHPSVVEALGPFSAVHNAEDVLIGFLGWAAALAGTPPKKYYYKASTLSKYIQNIKRLMAQKCGLSSGDGGLPAMLRLPQSVKGLVNLRDEGVLTRLAVAPQHLLRIAAAEGIVITAQHGRMPQVRFDRKFSRSEQRVKLAYVGACFDGFVLTMRASEFVSKTTTFDPLTELSRADVGYDNAAAPTRGWLHTKRYKGDRVHAWPNKTLAPAIGGQLCSMAIRLFYERLFPVPANELAHLVPYWQLPDKSPVTRARLQAFLQSHMQAMGLEKALYKSHSLRKGGVTAMLAAGVPHAQIQLMARWVSPNMVQLYAALDVNRSAAVLQALGSQSTLQLQEQENPFWEVYNSRPG